ncbi:MAG: transketolase-like TK C-terminal-containing protein, partial [Microbacterium gubbeenense]
VSREAVAAGVRRGAYVVRDAESPAALIIATGSEVALALESAALLAAEGLELRVVSMPSFEWFRQQPAEYRESVLPAELTARVSVEAASGASWREIVGDRGEIVSIDEFGLSAPADQAMAARGMTTENVIAAVRRAISH